MNTGFWCGKPRENDHLKYLAVDGDDIKMDLQEIKSRVWIVLELSGSGWNKVNAVNYSPVP